MGLLNTARCGTMAFPQQDCVQTTRAGRRERLASRVESSILPREVGMQYAILIHMDEQQFDQLPEAERQRLKTETDDLVGELSETGKLRGAAVLRGARTGRTVRHVEGKLSVTDGPFAETKEVLAGFQLVECASEDEAVAIAGRFPGIVHGMRIEVRPVADSCAELRGPSA